MILITVVWCDPGDLSQSRPLVMLNDVFWAAERAAGYWLGVSRQIDLCHI